MHIVQSGLGLSCVVLCCLSNCCDQPQSFFEDGGKFLEKVVMRGSPKGAPSRFLG